jgi:hypothetical protein
MIPFVHDSDFNVGDVRDVLRSLPDESVPANIVTLCATCHRDEHARGGGALYGAVHS